MSGVRSSLGYLSKEALSWEKLPSSIWYLEKDPVQGRSWLSKTPSSPLFNSFLLVLDGHLRGEEECKHT